MDRITSAYVEAFRKEQSLPAGDEALTFEHFVNYCVLSDTYEDEFDINDIHTGGGDDMGIDGLAIIVNGALVSDIEEIRDLISTNKFADVRFIFNQAKTSSSFSAEQFGTFGDGVEDFFAQTLSQPASERLQQFRSLMTFVFENSTQFKHGRPVCELNFITTGKWNPTSHLTAKITKIKTRLEELELFERVTFKPYGAADIQAAWNRTKNSATVEFNFANKVTLPEIGGITESYLGVVPLSEFSKIVADEETGAIRKQIFYDNVRDFQGENAVNSEMASSLNTPEGRDRFAVLNNGVTLVARSLRNTGNKFMVSDYQIVNGCQTSHVLHYNRAVLPENLDVPLKVIATSDEEVIASIITATNRQTQVSDEDLMALGTFQKDLEAYFGAFDDKKQLHYERRSRQFASVPVEKVRIITKTLALRSFAAMFLEDPRRAASYYGELKPQIGKTIFNAEHKLDPYYSASFGYYRLEYLFRNGQIPVKYKPARFQLLTAFRMLITRDAPPAFKSRQIEKYSTKINEALWSDTTALNTFRKAAGTIDAALDGKELTRENAKVQSFTDAVISKVKELR